MTLNSVMEEVPVSATPKTQTQYHVILLHRTQMESNIAHRLAVDGGLPFVHGNPDGWQSYRNQKFPNAWIIAALEESVAKRWYEALKERLPDAYIVPPTKVEVTL